MITRFHVENYKALRDVTLELTPIHVLIGPNDSGKTSIFEALIALSRLVSQGVGPEAFPGRWQGRELVWHGASASTIRFDVAFTADGERLEYTAAGSFDTSGQGFHSFTHSALDPRLRQILNSVQSFRWIPSHLGRPIAFRQQTRFMMESSGFGLALFLADILGQDHKLYGRLEERFREFFPYVQGIRLVRESGYNTVLDGIPNHPGYGIRFELADNGHVLPASQATDGLLLVLAYLALLHSPEPPRVLLIEEPENGIHPQRLKDVLKVLNELIRDQDRTQVLLTTHSPYVVDQFRPEEVTLCLKGDDGAVTIHRLSNSKTVREQMDIFQLGEIWTAEGDEALATQANHR
jgi:predicted ATPase